MGLGSIVLRVILIHFESSSISKIRKREKYINFGMLNCKRKDLGRTGNLRDC